MQQVMFKKSFEIRGHQRLSGADRKKVRRNLKERYGISDEELESICGVKEEISVTKLTSKVCVYAVEGGPPIFFDIDGRNKDILPTVFALWKLPSMVPSLELKVPEVSTFVLNGADLMLPGVKNSNEGSELPDFQEGDVLSVTVPGNEAPIAVGIALTNKEKAIKSGFKGKAVKILHHYLDSLWESSEGRYIPNPGFRADMVVENPELSQKSSLDSESTGEKSLEEENPEISGELEQIKDSRKTIEGKISEETSKFESLDLGENSGENEGNAELAVVPDSMDSLLDKCLLQTLKVVIKDKDLPILGSSLWANHMLQNRPPGSLLDIKKSSFKKLSKFLLSKAQEGLISVREEKHSKEIILTTVNRLHPAYKEYRPDPKNSNPVVPPPADLAQSDSTSPPPLEALEVYRPSSHMSPIFESLGEDRGRSYLAHEVSEVVFRYVGVQGLTSPQKPSEVILNPELCDALFKGVVKKGESFPSTVLKRDLGALAVQRMQAYHRVTRGDVSLEKKGSLPKIQLLAERRSSNKRVTRVTGVEGLLINPEILAEELQKKFASSTSLGALPGKKGQMEVLIQGAILEELGKYLVQRYGVPKRLIEVLDKTKK